MYNSELIESLAKLPKRFGWITDGKELGPDPLCDTPVLRSASSLALPTIGAIVPNWVLIVPRRCALSLSTLPSADRSDVLALATDVARLLGPEEHTVMFEHGPNSSGSVVGCGVDQAHLHVLNTAFDFASLALSDPVVEWAIVNDDDPWKSLDGSEYYFLRSYSATYVGKPKVPSSQFFRKHIAAAVGTPERWDYKCWPSYDNVRRTYERFTGRASASTV